MFNIRAARPDDVGVILDFIRQLAEYEKLLPEVTATAADLRLHLFGKHPAAEVLIAEMDGQSVGFALFFTSFSTFLGKPGIYLEDLFVIPSERGRGIGKELLRRLAAEVKKRGYARLEWAVLDWNTPSIAFYDSIGAKPMADWITYRLTGEALERLAH